MIRYDYLHRCSVPYLLSYIPSTFRRPALSPPNFISTLPLVSSSHSVLTSLLFSPLPSPTLSPHLLISCLPLPFSHNRTSSHLFSSQLSPLILSYPLFLSSPLLSSFPLFIASPFISSPLLLFYPPLFFSFHPISSLCLFTPSHLLVSSSPLFLFTFLRAVRVI